jgi:lipopolysaccharide assembly protein A
VLVVLAAFAGGLTIGALGMVPRWWKQRKAARRTPPSEGHSTLIGQGTPPTHGL